MPVKIKYKTNITFRFRGRDTLMYKNWRVKVLNKYGSRCADCGSYKQVECHHIKGWKDNPELRHDPDNGICLCVDCHCKHDELRKLYL